MLFGNLKVFPFGQESAEWWQVPGFTATAAPQVTKLVKSHLAVEGVDAQLGRSEVLGRPILL